MNPSIHIHVHIHSIHACIHARKYVYAHVHTCTCINHVILNTGREISIWYIYNGQCCFRYIAVEFLCSSVIVSACVCHCRFSKCMAKSGARVTENLISAAYGWFMQMYGHIYMYVPTLCCTCIYTCTCTFTCIHIHLHVHVYTYMY